MHLLKQSLVFGFKLDYLQRVCVFELLLALACILRDTVECGLEIALGIITVLLSGITLLL